MLQHIARRLERSGRSCTITGTLLGKLLFSSRGNQPAELCSAMMDMYVCRLLHIGRIRMDIK
jgi:hypothetical protein